MSERERWRRYLASAPPLSNQPRAGRDLQLAPEIWMRDRDQRLRPFRDRPATQFRDAIFRDHHVGIAAGGGDDAVAKARHDRRDGAAARRRRHRHDAATALRAQAPAHEIGVPADHAEMAPTRDLGIRLAAEIDLQRRVDADQIRELAVQFSTGAKSE